MELNSSIPAASVALEIRPFGSGHPGGPNPVANRGVELNRLYGRPDADGTSIRKYEQPWHRTAAYMLASGKYNAKQTAAACDKAYAGVLDLLKNAWFQETIAEIQKENGAQDLMDLFKAESVSSLLTLVELRDDTKAPASVRRASAVDILDRVLGKPTQRVETTDVPHSDDVVAEVARLEKENARLSNSSPASSAAANA